MTKVTYLFTQQPISALLISVPPKYFATLTDAKNQMTTYTYDNMDQLVTRKDALNRQETYQYDRLGNLRQVTDRKNQTTTFVYDSLNRRTGAAYPDASVTFGYDAIGRLTSVSDSVGGNITWTYDTVSSGHHPRVLETTTGTMTVEYDENGRRAKLSATGLTDVTYAYDNNSRLTGITQGTQTINLAYDDAGRRTSLTYPNGVVTSYGYDNANRMLTINHVKTPTTIEALTYQYDTSSNRISLNRANAAASLIPTAVSSNSYDAANEQTQFNGVTQTFDANGNLTNDGAHTYTWDARNRLTAISGGVTASFVYDGVGRRKSKTIGGTTTGFWYDGENILAELSGSTPSATYIRGLSIDEPYIRKSVSDEFYEVDALGSSIALTNTAGASQTTYTYEPFGKTTQAGTASTNSFQYTGRENDGTGLYQYRARYYGPVSLRFNSEDPFLFGGGDANSYLYALNNPLKYTDRRGLFVDTLLDVAFVGYDIYSLVTGRRKDFKNNLTALGLDTVGAVLPGVTGLGMVVRTEREVAVISKGLGNVAGGATTVESALVHGEKWLGPGYREIAPGVFRSADDTRQFRMTTDDLTDPRQGPHVHFESIGPNGRTKLESSHVTIINP